MLRQTQGSIAVIVSPLIAHMKDQVASFREKGVSAAYVTSECDVESEKMKDGVIDGRYRIIIRYVVHWGPPEDIEQYVQATGRAGRDGKPSHAILLFNNALKRYVDDSMVKYCKNQDKCRRRTLLCDFDDFNPTNSGCSCCDICRVMCKCGTNCEVQTLFT